MHLLKMNNTALSTIERKEKSITAFLDPTKPLATCSSENCNNCAAGEHVHCHFRAKELFHFYTIAFPSFLVGGAAILDIGG